MDSRETRVLIKRPGDIKGSLTKMQLSGAQVDRSVDNQDQGAFSFFCRDLE
jgi:hypothetical protein